MLTPHFDQVGNANELNAGIFRYFAYSNDTLMIGKAMRRTATPE